MERNVIGQINTDNKKRAERPRPGSGKRQILDNKAKKGRNLRKLLEEGRPGDSPCWVGQRTKKKKANRPQSKIGNGEGGERGRGIAVGKRGVICGRGKKSFLPHARGEHKKADREAENLDHLAEGGSKKKKNSGKGGAHGEKEQNGWNLGAITKIRPAGIDRGGRRIPRDEMTGKTKKRRSFVRKKKIKPGG